MKITLKGVEKTINLKVKIGSEQEITAIDGKFKVVTDITISPNPVETTFKVNVSESFSINIYDMQGTKVLSELDHQKNDDIDISSLNTGVYIATIKTKSKITIVKIVKK